MIIKYKIGNSFLILQNVYDIEGEKTNPILTPTDVFHLKSC